MAAAAIVLVSLLSLQLFFVDQPARSLAFETSPSTIFELTHIEQENPPSGMILHVGSRLQLEQGAVELTFDSGVKSIVLAPADMTLHDDDKLFLNKGTAWFHVPEGAEGFQVTTQNLDIVDLGTEFGVITNANDRDQVHVLKGKVAVTSVRYSDETAQLTAGQARSYDPVGSLEETQCDPEAFLVSLPESLPYIHWSFDSLEDGTLSVDGTHPVTHDLVSIVNAPNGGARLIPGKFGQAISLNGKGGHVTTNWSGFEGDRPRTVSFWLKLPKTGIGPKSAGILGWGDPSHTFAKWSMTVRQPNQEVNQAQLVLNKGAGPIIVKHPLKLGKWHHIAVSYSGKPDSKGQHLEQVYIDGQLVKLKASGALNSTPIDTSIIAKNSQPLSLGMPIRAEGLEMHYLNGRLDELYIFDGYMTQSQIRQLAQAPHNTFLEK